MNGGRSHPDNIREREVERSNVTLNTFFGASRQKSWMFRGGTPVRPTPRSSQAITALSQASLAPSVPSPVFNHKIRSASLGKKTTSPTAITESERSLDNLEKSRKDISIVTEKLIHLPTSRDLNLSQSVPDLNSVSSQPHSPQILDPNILGSVSKSSTDLTIDLQKELPTFSETELSATVRKESVTTLPKPSNIEISTESDAEIAPVLQEEPILEASEKPKAVISTGTLTQLRVDPVTDVYVQPIQQLSIDICETPIELDPESEGAAHNLSLVPSASPESTGRFQSEAHADSRKSQDPSDRSNIVQTEIVNAVRQTENSMLTQSVNNDCHNGSESVPPKTLSPNLSLKPNSPAQKSHNIGCVHDIALTEESSMSSPPQSNKFTLKSKLTMIEAQLKSVGGLESLNTGLERPRFQLLIEACRVEDFFYVIFHQIYILWDFRREEVLTIQEIIDINSLQTGFRIVAKIIHDNNQLAPNHKRWPQITIGKPASMF
ncbi:putative miz zinc finger domain protein [Erysiphe necator]|uniref:Putative miz zinc finger domain protein n=1 Tax=Uncinula necator TaxID=52586 RepID=A0A0B1PA69_UNCNE|nr:putative miz zinc finger domain protein [Erysiphe necator]